ncbi:MAG: sulfotransferase [Desulfobacterales bacterium]|nr:sulfotransferase [Desulfobacterales bacterium]
MIEKPSIIVTSLGRTGTLFFQNLFDASLLYGTCLHEPDRLNFGQYEGMGDKAAQVYRQIRESGVFELLIRKFIFSDWSIEAVSKDRETGKLSDPEAIKRIISQRKKFIQRQPGSIYLESSSAFYGIIDLLDKVFYQHRVIYIIRDGRDWVRSKMNFGTMYAKNPLQKLISGSWPTAVELNDSVYGEKWHEMTRFEKICWAWAELNQYALKCAAKNPYARVVRFEDVLSSPDAAKNLSDLIDFAVSISPAAAVKKKTLKNWLPGQTHASQKLFPDWCQWNNKQTDWFIQVCGPLMKKLGYELKS